MFWAACNLAYFGFLRSAEFTVPNLASYVPDIHLGVADVAVDSHSSPSCLRLRVKASKTDPFRKGCFLHIGKGEFPLCAISSLLGIFDPEGRCLGPIISVSGRTAFIPRLTDFMVTWHFVCSGYPRQFLQPQLSDWSRNGSSKEWHSGPSNSSLGSLDKLGLLVVHSYACGVVVSTV